MMCASTRRCAFRAPWPGVLGRSITSLSGTSGSKPAPYRSLSRSASSWVTWSPCTMSAVTCPPAQSSEPVWRILPF